MKAIAVEHLKEGNRQLNLLVATGVLLQFLNGPAIASDERMFKWLVLALILCLVGAWWVAQRRDVCLPRIFQFFLPCCGLVLVSAWQGHAPYESLLGTAMLGLGLVMIAMTADLGQGNPRFPAILASFIFSAGTAAALLGLYEYFHYAQLGPAKTPLIPFLLPPDADSRVVGHLGQPNQLALFLTLSLLAAFYLYLHGELKEGARRFGALCYLPIVLLSWVIFLTHSRAGFLSLFFTFIILAWLVVSRRYLLRWEERREFFKLLLCLALGFFIAKGGGWLLKSLAAADGPGTGLLVHRGLGEATVGSDGRYVFWTAGLLLFMDHPWLGVGLGGYKYFLPDYAIKAHDLLGFVPYENLRYTYWAHNEIIQLLAETGIFIVPLVLAAIAVLALRGYRWFVKNPIADERPFFLYSHLLLLPFLIQAQFEWVLRSPGILALFFLLVGGLLSQYQLQTLHLSLQFRAAVATALVMGVALTGVLVWQDVKIGRLKQLLLEERPLRETLPVMAELTSNPYGEFLLLDKGLPVFIEKALRENDSSFARHLIPYADRVSLLRGTWKDWYGLALLHLKAGDEKAAVKAIQRAIDVQPSANEAWHFLHYLNILEAARRTGQSVDKFFLKVPGGEAKILESFYGGNRIPRGLQDL